LSSVKPIRLHGLDTLRATAIVAVVIFHLQSFLPHALEPVASIGWIGVDLFFTLSGFLIGSQLLKPFVRGQPLDLMGFYMRRAYRILPAYWAVLLLYFAVPAWREHPGLPHAWKFLTFTANLKMNYPAELAFSHVWSLCIEEHFYLLLPCVVIWQMRKPAVWKTVILIASVVLFGVLIRSWELLHIVRAPGLTDVQVWTLFMKRVYYPTYSRLDGLVSGVALACIQAFRPAWWAKVSQRGNSLLAAGLLLSTAAIWTFKADFPFADRPAGVLLGFPLVSLGFGLLVAAATSKNGLLRVRVPGGKAVATLAFSLYLTHKEVAHLDQHIFPWLTQENGWLAAGIYAASCLACAGLLYACVERPFLVLRDRHIGKRRATAANVGAQFEPAL
jgi:peptidoglycan/LPS O-acetylase OafA/YrhL